MYEVALIGTGNMGSAMLGGWLESGTLAPSGVLVTDNDRSKAEQLADRFGVDSAEGNREAANAARIVVLAVKPQDSADVLEDISGVMSADKVVVSIVAGLSIASMRDKLGVEPMLIRAMPNMGARVGASVSGYAIDGARVGSDVVSPVRLIEAIGEVVEVEEKNLDLVTAISGSGPAYFFLMVEALEEAAVKMGMQDEVARTLARETIWGAAKVLKESDLEAEELRRAVSSPGGTTLAALKVLEEAGFMMTMSRAVRAAHKRAGELTR